MNRKIIVIQPHEKDEVCEKVREAITELTERTNDWEVKQIVISLEVIK